MEDMTDPTGDDDALDVVVTNNEAARRYEVHIGATLAGLTTYLLDDERVVFTHAEVYPQWEGKGVGTALARGALDDVIARGKLITPKCPFIVDFVRRHPSYVAHVDPVHRHEFEAVAPDSSEQNAGRQQA
jgi:predicted GNAT family acetyltransferase